MILFLVGFAIGFFTTLAVMYIITMFAWLLNEMRQQ